MKDHSFYMNKALELALKGKPSPNPFVGCVIVKNDKVIGLGYHQKAGESHAEINAINDAKKHGHSLKDSIMYVTLEPCCHQGKTPPCVNKIIEEKIGSIFIATKDPNPIVYCNGIKTLENSGINVTTGLLEKKAILLNEKYNHFIKNKTPFVLIKTALSLDGKITYGDRKNKSISNKEAKKFVHKCRDEYDAILVGINTILLDNPMLNCRTENGIDPYKIILDSKLKIPLGSKVLTNSPDKTVIFTTKQCDEKKKNELTKLKSVTLIELEKITIPKVLEELGKRNISSLMVEGGTKIIESFIESNNINKINLIFSPQIIGGKNDFFKGKEILKQINNGKTIQLGDNFLFEGYFE